MPRNTSGAGRVQNLTNVETDSYAAKTAALAVKLGGGWQLREGQDLVPADIKEQMRTRANWGRMIDSDKVED